MKHIRKAVPEFLSKGRPRCNKAALVARLWKAGSAGNAPGGGADLGRVMREG
ncbi:hypothetical protein [Novosphingobium sp.]|uniref:hypothetical protein n=1 Tax=Novosphingobium sp. TaxID=1874826 RepID=UPI00286DEEB2|nr:hypothetical protein [Novosphingobium sp.]